MSTGDLPTEILVLIGKRKNFATRVNHHGNEKNPVSFPKNILCVHPFIHLYPSRTYSVNQYYNR